jgi:hypothetical protein
MYSMYRIWSGRDGGVCLLLFKQLGLVLVLVFKGKDTLSVFLFGTARDVVWAHNLGAVSGVW